MVLLLFVYIKGCLTGSGTETIYETSDIRAFGCGQG